MRRKLRTAARLTSKPMTPEERYDAGKRAANRAAFAGATNMRAPQDADDEFRDGWQREAARLSCDMTGR